jgi:hypothetical protein
MIPDDELSGFVMTITDAADLARDGDPAGGYEVPLAGQQRGEGLAQDISSSWSWSRRIGASSGRR